MFIIFEIIFWIILYQTVIIGEYASNLIFLLAINVFVAVFYIFLYIYILKRYSKAKQEAQQFRSYSKDLLTVLIVIQLLTLILIIVRNVDMP